MFDVACRIHHEALKYVSFGKPNPFVFKNAEKVLSRLQYSYHNINFKNYEDRQSHPLKTLYMIGDNPLVDVKGSRLVCTASLMYPLRLCTYDFIQFYKR